MSRNSTMLHGVLVVVAALLMVPVLDLIPLASLAALVMAVGIQMVSLHHIRTVTRHREVLVYAVTTLGVAALGVLQGVLLGVAVAVAVALHRLTRTRITYEETGGVHYVHARGQLTFLAVPRLSRVLHLVPHGAHAEVELDGSFMDHAAYESLRDWQRAHTAQGGSAELTGWRPGVGSPEYGHRPKVRMPHGPGRRPGGYRSGGHELARGVSAFQRDTAPLVRDELARLAREGQQPSQLFLTCADSRLVTSMITSSGPGDLFVVRNVGNLVPLPGEENGDDSVAAAIEYAVDVLKVRYVTVCGHSGCGAMQALTGTGVAAGSGEGTTPLGRWLRHGLPSLARLADDSRPRTRLAGRATMDAVERLCLANVVQQLEHLRAHAPVARALEAGELELHGMYFHVGEAQAYLLGRTEGEDGVEVFEGVPGTEEPRDRPTNRSKPIAGRPLSPDPRV